jgi:hypothetical protein
MPWNRATEPPVFHRRQDKINNINILRLKAGAEGCPHPLDNTLLLWYYRVSVCCSCIAFWPDHEGCETELCGVFWMGTRDVTILGNLGAVPFYCFQEARPRDAKQFQLEV